MYELKLVRFKTVGLHPLGLIVKRGQAGWMAGAREVPLDAV